MLPALVGVGAFSALVPPLANIRRCDPSVNPEFVADVRAGELAAVTVTMAIGVMAANVMGERYPLYIAGITAIGMTLLYECYLRGDRPFSKGLNDAA